MDRCEARLTQRLAAWRPFLPKRQKKSIPDRLHSIRWRASSKSAGLGFFAASILARGADVRMWPRVKRSGTRGTVENSDEPT
jgi:hypothetical protein